MAFEIKGQVIFVGPTQQVTDKLKKREVVVQYAENPTYPEEIKFEAVNDKCAALDELRAGDEVNVHFNLRGRSYTDKAGKKAWFNSLGLWKYDILKTSANNPGGYTAAQAPDLDSEDSPF